MHHSMNELRQFSRARGLSITQLSVLFHLYYGAAGAHSSEQPHPICGVSDIGEHLGITNAAASQLTDRLVIQGLLERSEDAQDRRMRPLRLTTKGEALVVESIEARQRWIEQLTETLTGDEQEAIIAALTTLTRAARLLDGVKEENIA